MMITLYDGLRERGGQSSLTLLSLSRREGSQSAAGRKEGSTPDSTLGQDVLSRVEDRPVLVNNRERAKKKYVLFLCRRREKVEHGRSALEPSSVIYYSLVHMCHTAADPVPSSPCL